MQPWGQCLSRVLGATQPFGGVKPGLDALGELDFFLSGEQGNPADLLEIRAD